MMLQRQLASTAAVGSTANGIKTQLEKYIRTPEVAKFAAGADCDLTV